MVDKATLLQIFQDHKSHLLPLAKRQTPLLRFVNTDSYLGKDCHEFTDFCRLAKRLVFPNGKNPKDLFILLSLQERKYGSVLLFQDKANLKNIAVTSLNTFIINQSPFSLRGLTNIPQYIAMPTWIDIVLDGDIDPRIRKEEAVPHSGKRQLYKSNQQLLTVYRRRSTQYVITDNQSDPVKQTSLLINGSFDRFGVRGKKLSSFNTYLMPIICHLDNVITVRYNYIIRDLSVSYTNKGIKNLNYPDRLEKKEEKIDTDQELARIQFGFHASLDQQPESYTDRRIKSKRKSQTDKRQALAYNEVKFFRPFVKGTKFSIKLKDVYLPKQQLMKSGNKGYRFLFLKQKENLIILNESNFYFNKKKYSFDTQNPIRWVVENQKEVNIHFRLNKPPELQSNVFAVQATRVTLNGRNYYSIAQSALPFLDEDDLEKIQVYTKLHTSVFLQPINGSRKVLNPISVAISTNPLFVNVSSIPTIKKSAQKISHAAGHLLLASPKSKFSIGIRAKDVYGAMSSLYHLNVSTP